MLLFTRFRGFHGSVFFFFLIDDICNLFRESFSDRVRIATRSHAPSRHAPGHVERFRGWYRVWFVPVRIAHGQQSTDALDRAHVRRLQGVHVLFMLGNIYRAHGPPGAHDRRPFQRNPSVRLSKNQLPS